MCGKEGQGIGQQASFSAQKVQYNDWGFIAEGFKQSYTNIKIEVLRLTEGIWAILRTC